jgi:hypothetical protein
MAAPSEEKLICDKFNLEAPLTVNQVKVSKLWQTGQTIRVPLLSTLGRSRIQFEDSRFNISLVTATSTRIQSEDVLHGAHVIDEM